MGKDLLTRERVQHQPMGHWSFRWNRVLIVRQAFGWTRAQFEEKKNEKNEEDRDPPATLYHGSIPCDVPCGSKKRVLAGAANI
jgi:hypothetical protein